MKPHQTHTDKAARAFEINQFHSSNTQKFVHLLLFQIHNMGPVLIGLYHDLSIMLGNQRKDRYYTTIRYRWKRASNIFYLFEIFLKDYVSFFYVLDNLDVFELTIQLSNTDFHFLHFKI